MKIYGLNQDEASVPIRSGQVTISVFGLGRMGLPLAAVLSEAGPEVIGVDIVEEIVASVNCGECPIPGEPGLSDLVMKGAASGQLRATSDTEAAAASADVLIIAVPATVTRESWFDLSNLKSLYRTIGFHLEPGDLVIQEATVPLGSCQGELFPILLASSKLSAGEFGFAFCPPHARYGSMIDDIRGSHRKIVGGVDRRSGDSASALYSAINTSGTVTVRDATTAEAVKLFAATAKDVNIALANEFAKVCDEVGIDAGEVAGALSAPPAYVSVYTAGCGVGGHCIPVCGYGIRGAITGETPLITLARQINDTMPDYVVRLLQHGLEDHGIHLRDAQVLVLGLTYRGDVKDTLNSPAVTLVERMKPLCHKVFAYDPMLREEAGRFGLQPLESLNEVGHSAQIDAVVIGSDHPTFVAMDWAEFGRRLRKRVVVDGRQCLDLKELRNEGWTALGVGRVS